MSMKENTRNFFVNVLVIYFALDLVGKSIHVPSRVAYLIITVVLLSLALIVTPSILKFLTVKCNFITFFLMSSVLLVGVFYLLKAFMIDFSIDEFEFNGSDLGSLSINSFVVTPLISIVSTSILISLLMSVYKELDRS